jgi:hypothetical protein
MENFDFKGEIDQVDPESVTMTVGEVFKGLIKENTIQLLRVEVGCMHYLDFKTGDKLIIKLEFCGGYRGRRKAEETESLNLLRSG